MSFLMRVASLLLASCSCWVNWSSVYKAMILTEIQYQCLPIATAEAPAGAVSGQVALLPTLRLKSLSRLKSLMESTQAS